MPQRFLREAALVGSMKPGLMAYHDAHRDRMAILRGRLV